MSAPSKKGFPLPGTSAEKQVQPRSKYDNSWTKVLKKGIYSRDRKKDTPPSNDSTTQLPDRPTNQEHAPIRRTEHVGCCIELFTSHRKSCILFGSINLLDITEHAYVGCGTSVICGISSLCLIIGGALRVRLLLWVPMTMTLLHFIPFAIFVYVVSEITDTPELVAVTLTCILSIIVLAFSLYELMLVVSYYVRLGKRDEQLGPLAS